MLTINSKANVVSNTCSVSGTDTLTNILNDVNTGYFYMKSDGIISVKGSLFFSLDEEDLGVIPDNAVINNIGVKFYTLTQNNIGVYDTMSFRLNNNLLATIENTNLIPNTISETSYSAERMFSSDIYKENLLGYRFECQLVTEGSKEFRLLGLTVTVSYTEMMATSTSRIVLSSGIVDLPLYTPLEMPRYALRVVTDSGIKAFDLVGLNNPQASPLRVMTASGIKAVRMSLEKPSINLFSAIEHPHSSGYYFNTNGDLREDTNSIYMKDYLEVGEGLYAIQCASNSFSSVTIVTIFYDPNKTILGSNKLTTNNTLVTFPSKTKYIRFSIKANNNNVSSKSLFDAYSSMMIYKN